ncbi:MAG TPA: MMPL family transporter [Nocardioidaceae bacterium]|nr:MMPL family transporter [Nocardioidaceae bacterium]
MVWGTGVFGSLGDDGFDDPDSEASRAAHAAEGILGGTEASASAYVDRLEAMDGATGVTVAGSRGDDTVLDVTHRFDVYSASAKQLVRDVRAMDPDTGTALVTGTTAFLIDVLDSLGSQLPLMAGWVFVSTFLLLFLAFGSLVLRTGGIIASAALLLVVVIGAFSTSGITFIKMMIGVGMALAIVIDATVVRALLVPATMRLMGSANWWLPAPLERLWRRVGVREYDGPRTALPA